MMERLVYRYIAEGLVWTPCAECVAEKICARSSAHCQSINAHNTDKLLDFGTARAILTTTDDALHFRVEAQDFVIFSGIRTLMEGSLATITTILDAGIAWHTTGSAPWGAVSGRLKNRDRWRGE